MGGRLRKGRFQMGPRPGPPRGVGGDVRGEAQHVEAPPLLGDGVHILQVPPNAHEGFLQEVGRPVAIPASPQKVGENGGAVRREERVKPGVAGGSLH